MAVVKGRVVRRVGGAAARDVRVHGAVQLAERVCEALGVGDREVRASRGGLVESEASRGSSSFGRPRWPIQSSSCRSASHASEVCDPSTSKRSEFFRPRDTCETMHDPRDPFS